MKKAILALLLATAGASAAPAADTSPLEVFGKTIAVALFSNDLASVTNAYVQPGSPFVAEIAKSWRKTREMGDYRSVQWTTCTVSDVRIKKLTQQADRRVADVIVDGETRDSLFVRDDCVIIQISSVIHIIDPEMDFSEAPESIPIDLTATSTGSVDQN